MKLRFIGEDGSMGLKNGEAYDARIYIRGKFLTLLGRPSSSMMRPNQSRMSTRPMTLISMEATAPMLLSRRSKEPGSCTSTATPITGSTGF